MMDENMKDNHVYGISFTQKGRRLLEQIQSFFPDRCFTMFFRENKNTDIPLKKIMEEAFLQRTAVIFVGAMGILIRAMAPFVKDKMTDPPIVVLDEAGRFCIPVLSGHMGGANELAAALAQKLDATLVLTTATDVSGAFSVDLFAKERNLSIVNREAVRHVSTKSLEGKPVTLCIKDYPPLEPVDVMVSDDAFDDAWGRCALRKDVKEEGSSNNANKKKYVIGMGVKKDKDFKELLSFIMDVLSENHIKKEEVAALSTIDRKQKERAFLELSKRWKIPLLTFEATALNRVNGDFEGSDFVAKTVGTDNVCERSAVLAAGKNGKLVVRKTVKNGMTMAVAMCEGELLE